MVDLVDFVVVSVVAYIGYLPAVRRVGRVGVLLAVCLLLLTKPACGASASPAFEYLFEEGSGTTATNTGTVGAASNGSIGEGVTYSMIETPLGTCHSLDFEGIGDDSFPKTKGRVFVPEDYNYGDQVTIEAWIKPDKTDGQRVVWDDFNGYGLLLGIWDGQVQFGGATTGNLSVANFSGQVETGKWQHIAGVYDGSALRVCVDGQDTGTSVPASGEFVERIGEGGGFIGNGSGENLPFDGKIDDLRVWPVDTSPTPPSPLSQSTHRPMAPPTPSGRASTPTTAARTIRAAALICRVPAPC